MKQSRNCSTIRHESKPHIFKARLLTKMARETYMKVQILQDTTVRQLFGMKFKVNLDHMAYKYDTCGDDAKLAKFKRIMVELALVLFFTCRIDFLTNHLSLLHNRSTSPPPHPIERSIKLKYEMRL